MDLIKQLCEIQAPSGEEVNMKEFLLSYINKNQENWLVKPQIIHGEDFQDSLMLVFGNPRTAVFAHMDSIGFTVRYLNQLVAIGGPHVEDGYKLVGNDNLGPIECELAVIDDQVSYKFGRAIQRGTSLTFSCNFRNTEEYIQSCSLDNSVGIYNALKLAETLKDGVIVFSCWEEHGGGSVPYLAKFIFERYNIRQALISDITWITEGVTHGEGVVISMRDKNIPRRSFINKIIQICKEAAIDYQLEVEGHGSSDGRELQTSPYPFDWCFIGAPEDNVHSPDEIVHKHDIHCMLKAYKVLMEKL
jgi:putative aminopeptidase FrvX